MWEAGATTGSGARSRKGRQPRETHGFLRSPALNSQVGQGGDIREDALREGGDIVAMERPVEDREPHDPSGSRTARGALGCAQPDSGARAHWAVTAAHGGQGTRGHSQQPQGAEALEGQWRDALQGVVAEDPVQRKEATQRGHPEPRTAPPVSYPPHQLRAQLHSDGRSPGLWCPLGTPSLRQGSLQPSAHTYRVVSWLMLVKEELLSELILLLLRSLQNTDPGAVAAPVPSRCTPRGAQGHTASQP